VKIVEGKFGKKEDTSIKTSEFLAALAIRSSEYEEEERPVKCVVIMYEDGEVFEVTATEQYPDGVYLLLGLAQAAIVHETLGIT
jgi:hypothetical protein|tara:strand:- start:828 stop:1079 length:252 start_codon:yes stop_codon:yes gene_type:complete